jgi:hypothetical protein
LELLKEKRKSNEPSILNPRSGGISTGSGRYLTDSVPHGHSLIFKNKINK